MSQFLLLDSSLNSVSLFCGLLLLLVLNQCGVSQNLSLTYNDDDAAAHRTNPWRPIRAKPPIAISGFTGSSIFSSIPETAMIFGESTDRDVFELPPPPSPQQQPQQSAQRSSQAPQSQAWLSALSKIFEEKYPHSFSSLSSRRPQSQPQLQSHPQQQLQPRLQQSQSQPQPQQQSQPIRELSASNIAVTDSMVMTAKKRPSISELLSTPIAGKHRRPPCSGPFEQSRFPEQICFPLYDDAGVAVSRQCVRMAMPTGGGDGGDSSPTTTTGSSSIAGNCECVRGAQRNPATGQCEIAQSTSSSTFDLQSSSPSSSSSPSLSSSSPSTKLNCDRAHEELVNIAGCLPNTGSDGFPPICLPPEMRCLCTAGYVRDLASNDCVQLSSSPTADTATTSTTTATTSTSTTTKDEVGDEN